MSQLGIRAKVNDYLGSSVGVVISIVLIPASHLGIRAKVNDYLGSSGLGIHKFSPDTSFTAWYQSIGIRLPRA